MVGYKSDFDVTDLQIKFSSSQTLSQLKGIVTSTGVKRMLEKKDSGAIDAVFPFVAAFIDRATGYSKEPLLKALHVTYANVINRLLHCKSPLYYSSGHGLPISENTKGLKAISKQILEGLNGIILFTLKFHILKHISEDSLRFGDLGLLDASPFEHFNHTIETFIE